jgi:hypothetical protein
MVVAIRTMAITNSNWKDENAQRTLMENAVTGNNGRTAFEQPAFEKFVAALRSEFRARLENLTTISSSLSSRRGSVLGRVFGGGVLGGGVRKAKDSLATAVEELHEIARVVAPIFAYAKKAGIRVGQGNADLEDGATNYIDSLGLDLVSTVKKFIQLTAEGEIRLEDQGKLVEDAIDYARDSLGNLDLRNSISRLISYLKAPTTGAQQTMNLDRDFLHKASIRFDTNVKTTKLEAPIAAAPDAPAGFAPRSSSSATASPPRIGASAADNEQDLPLPPIPTLPLRRTPAGPSPLAKSSSSGSPAPGAPLIRASSHDQVAARSPRPLPPVPTAASAPIIRVDQLYDTLERIPRTDRPPVTVPGVDDDDQQEAAAVPSNSPKPSNRGTSPAASHSSDSSRA